MKYLHSLCLIEPQTRPRPKPLYGFWENFGSTQSGLCWTLSNLRLLQNKKEADSVEFWGDSHAKEFISKLNLRYDQIRDIEGGALEAAPKRLWSFGKLWVMAQQTEPFLHIDGDVFFAQPPPEDWIAAPFIVQGREIWDPDRAWSWFYGVFSTLLKAGVRSPLMDAVWDVAHSPDREGDTNVWNFGVVGGSSSKLPELCREVCEFATQNKEALDSCGGKIFVPVVLEQMWIPLLMAAEGISPTPLLDEKRYQEHAVEIGYCHYLEHNKTHPEQMAKVKARVLELDPQSEVLKLERDVYFAAANSPRMLEKIKTLSEAMAEWGKKGLPIVSEQAYLHRLSMCQSCEHWDAKGYLHTGKCNKCGCAMYAKLRMATTKCPIDKWGPEIYAEPTTNT